MAAHGQLPIIVMQGLETYPPVAHGSLHDALLPYGEGLLIAWAVAACVTMALLAWRFGRRKGTQS